ncbi:hypothetical protein LSAT2_025194 [Lamellibrachia satsuma]|nr:hypothetical protein LSAT2_025194 [Lamellibrachia satsuma]
MLTEVDQTVGPDETGMQHEEFMDSDENALEAVAEPEPEPVTEPEAVAEPVAEPEAVAELEVFSEPEMKSVASTAPLSPLQLRGFSESALDKVANVESEAATLYLQESVMNEWAVALGTHSLADLTELRDKDVQKQEDPEQMGRSSVIDLINILRTPLADIEGEISTEVPNDPSPRATTNPILTSTTEQSAPQKRKMKQQDDWSKALGS